MKLLISIEENGQWKYIGDIAGNDYRDAVFTYDKKYLTDENGTPVSISLPLQENSFTPNQTRNFFEGLLPEGFTRRSVAGYLHVDESDYIQILRALGKECIGAIRVDTEDYLEESSYDKLSLADIKALAGEGVTKSTELVIDSRISLAGASGKVGLLYYNNEWYLPKGDAPSNYIVKQSHVRLNNIVLNEQFCQMTAAHLGIDVPASMILNTGLGKDDEVLFASSRFDRMIDSQSKLIGAIPAPYRLHQEDFAQALGISAIQKYERTPSEHYLKKIFDLIRTHSTNPMKDQLKMWDLTIVNFMLGNTDCHLKNVSLLYSRDLKSISLAPCYDILSTAIYSNSTSNMAFSIDGKYDINSINRQSFENEANSLGLGKKIAMQHFDDIANRFADAINDVADELSGIGFSSISILKDRISKSFQNKIR